MAKYHISSKTGKVKPCSATKRACRYGQHFSSAAEANKEVLKNSLQALNNAIASTAPSFVNNIPDSPLHEPHNPTNITWACDWSDDPYENHNESYGDDEYISHYGATIDVIHVKGVLSAVFGCPEDEISQEWVDFAVKNGWDRPENYSIEVESDYYEDSVEISPPKDMVEKLQEEYWKLPNAVDREGILSYTRGKGLDTTGLTPHEAIVKQMNTENGGKTSAKVNRTKQATVENLKLHEVTVSQGQHYSKVQPRMPKKALAQSREIAGVVVKENGNYFLVDGYHRLKYLNQNRPKLGKGNFIVLS